jgi:2-polyprenyl-6-methoxyphenol hydroxylase-like FAD-dependent oxidoreductase
MPETCCIVGGGPAGMMLGYLLARAGLKVLVLEKHADFLRDFRGDTVHPSTLETMHELGFLDEFLKLPHRQLTRVRARIGGEDVTLGDMSKLATRCRFMALIPQWDLLNFLADQGCRYPGFHLRMQTEVTGLIEERARIQGVHARTPAGPAEIRADLVIGADGRSSVVRDHAGLEVITGGAPTDVLWMRLSRRSGDPDLFAYSDRRKVFVLIDRGDYWQCGVPVPKGSFGILQSKGIEAFRADIVQMAPFLSDRVSELRDWIDVKVLTVKVGRLRQWYRPGLLCIGDAAHAMSPIGGVGINLAIQDAVAAANVLIPVLIQDSVNIRHLRAIQRRRELPTRLTQFVQELIRRQIGGCITDPEPKRLPWPVRLLEKTGLPCLVRTRFLALGIRPEHIDGRLFRPCPSRVDGF